MQRSGHPPFSPLYFWKQSYNWAKAGKTSEGLSLPAECRGNVSNTDPSLEGGFGEPLLHLLLLERWSPVQQERPAGKGER